jgi:murein DD-endopeptidase MepM/ murein hydrolase activator NlpD
VPVRGPAGGDERARLHQAAQALETMVVKQLVTASKAFTGGEGAGSAVRADQFADALAGAMVEGGGIGLARQIEDSVLRTVPGGAAPHPGPLPARGGREGSAGPARLTSGFGLRQDPFDGHLTRHAGVDLAGDEGEPIRAAASGVVVRAGPRAGYGEAIELAHGDGRTTLYAHASELLVREGETVAAGQPIARVGETGRATGPHLHFEVRQGGQPVDPARALKIYRVRADDLIGSGS